MGTPQAAEGDSGVICVCPFTSDSLCAVGFSHPFLPKCSLGQRLSQNGRGINNVYRAVYNVNVQITSYSM